MKKTATPKQRVLKRYPKAFSSRNMGGDAVRVFSGVELIQVIGIGTSAHEAWSDAAEFVRRYGG